MDQGLKAYLEERDRALHDIIRLVGCGLLGVNDRIEFLRAETTYELAKLRSAIGPDIDLSARIDRLEERLRNRLVVTIWKEGEPVRGPLHGAFLSVLSPMTPV